MAPITISPMHDFGLCRSRRSQSGRPGSLRARARAGNCCTLSGATPPWAGSSTPIGCIWDTFRIARPHARAEDEIEESQDEVGHADAVRESEQQALRERIVAAQSSLLQR